MAIVAVLVVLAGVFVAGVLVYRKNSKKIDTVASDVTSTTKAVASTVKAVVDDIKK